MEPVKIIDGGSNAVRIDSESRLLCICVACGKEKKANLVEREGVIVLEEVREE